MISFYSLLTLIDSICQDDVNEKVFEASIAAEILRSVIAISHADIITDFIMAEHGNRKSNVNPRLVLAF